MPGSALYLYCVLPAPGAVPRVAAPALDGGPVHAVRLGGLAVLAHSCPPEPYQGGNERVRHWVAAHHAVVAEAWAAAGSVLPMSFDVIVSPGGGHDAEANLTGWIAEHRAALHGRLAQLAGRAEVGVQVLREAAGPPPPGAGAAGAAPVPRGRAFFARQERDRQARSEREQRAGLDSRRHLEALAALADEVRVGRPRPVPGQQMILNLSLLVVSAAVPRVGDYLESVAGEPGTEVRFTGPWPPYSFAGSFGKIEHGTGAAAAGGEGRQPPGTGVSPIGNGGA